MKILFFVRNLGKYHCSWASFFEALNDHPYVKCWGPGFPQYDEISTGKYVDVPNVIDKLYPNDYPDVVMQPSTLVHCKMFHRLRGFEKAKCLKVMWCSDFHNDVGQNRVYQYIKDGNIDVIFKAYDVNNESEWSKKLLDTDVSLEWSPFSIDPKWFYDRNLPKIFDVLNIGQSTTQNYPFRYKIHELLKDQSKIRYYVKNVSKVYYDEKSKKFQEDESMPDIPFKKRSWPRTFNFFLPTEKYAAQKYVSLINQSRMFTTDCSTYQFAVQKMFEVMACNTLLLCNTPLSAEKLGFKSKVNYVDWEHEPKQSIDVDDKKVMELINYYLENPDEASKIALRGHELVHSRHKHDVRMKEFFSALEKYL